MLNSNLVGSSSLRASSWAEGHDVRHGAVRGKVLNGLMGGAILAETD